MTQLYLLVWILCIYSLHECVPFFSVVYGPYWQHLKEAWEKKDNPNLHFIFYEDLKTNNMEELKKLDAFLGTNLTQEQLDNVSSTRLYLDWKFIFVYITVSIVSVSRRICL